MTAPAAVEFNDATLKLLKSTNPSERARFYTVVGELPPEENEKCVRASLTAPRACPTTVTFEVMAADTLSHRTPVPP